ncbi:recombinase family protein [Candidatus Parcubacteria bacterium]|nr:MAG: recombinase family protein [Candidatus Parcubacteria bacterium]
MLVGYQRVSTDDQDLSLQRDALIEAGVDPDHIYEDRLSGAKSDRPGLQACMKALRAGDVLVVWRLDRLARSLKDLIRIADDLEARGIGLRSLQEQIDTTSAAGRLFFHLMGALAEFERNLIRERTKAGLDAARRRGRKPGRKRKLSPKQIQIAETLLKDDTLTVREIAEQIGISPATFYRYFPGGRTGAES